MTKSAQIKLSAYAEMINVSEDEALSRALCLALMFHRLELKYGKNTEVTKLTAISRYTIEMKLRQDKTNKYKRDYYNKHKIEINKRRKELKLIKKGSSNEKSIVA